MLSNLAVEAWEQNLQSDQLATYRFLPGMVDTEPQVHIYAQSTAAPETNQSD